jgi:hypothetical protein
MADRAARRYLLRQVVAPTSVATGSVTVLHVFAAADGVRLMASVAGETAAPPNATATINRRAKRRFTRSSPVESASLPTAPTSHAALRERNGPSGLSRRAFGPNPSRRFSLPSSTRTPPRAAVPHRPGSCGAGTAASCAGPGEARRPAARFIARGRLRCRDRHAVRRGADRGAATVRVADRGAATVRA